MIQISFTRKSLRRMLLFLQVAIRLKENLLTRSTLQELMRETTVEAELKTITEMRAEYHRLSLLLYDYEDKFLPKPNDN